MLNKSILLHLRIAQKEISVVFYAIIIFLLMEIISASSFFFPGTYLLLIALMFFLVFYIKVINKICFSSFFDKEGTMYMTLPLSAKEMILGKVLALSGFMFVSELLLIGSMVLTAIYADVSLYDFLPLMSEELPSIGTTKLETSLAFGLLPLAVFLENVFTVSFIQTVFLAMGLRKQRLVFCWIIVLIATGIFDKLGEQLVSAFDEMMFGNSIGMIVQALVYLLLSTFLIRYCIKCLEEKYQI